MSIRVGLVGAGFVGPAHVEALRRLGYVEVLALAESNSRRARDKADVLGIPEACGDYRQLLANPRITVIHNATPNNMHFAVNRDALNAGKHVVSEKPLALTATEGEELVNLAKETELVNAVNFNYRGYPLVRQMRAMVAAGEIGDVWLVHGSYLQDWMLNPTDYSWRVEPQYGGPSRAMADIGSHWCDLAQWVTSKRITRVQSRLSTMLPTRQKPAATVEAFGRANGPTESVHVQTEDYAGVLFDMEGGVTGSLTVSQVSAGRKNRLWIEIDGSKGSLAWDQDRPDELWIGKRGEANRVLARDPGMLAENARRGGMLPGGHVEGWADALRNNFADIYEFIRTERNPVRVKPEFATFQDGLVESRVVEAVLASQERQGWATVPAEAEVAMTVEEGIITP